MRPRVTGREAVYPVLQRPYHHSLLRGAFLVAATFSAFSCGVPLGPSFTIEKQSVTVHFRPGPEPRVELAMDYGLRNTGNQPLQALELRLPSGKSFQLASVSLSWDAQAIPFDRRSDPWGEVLHLTWSVPWAIKQTHALHVEYSLLPGNSMSPRPNLFADYFYLPPGAWLAAPLRPPGTFSSGGVFPKSWTLSLIVPQDFVVHGTGRLLRHEATSGETRVQFQPQAKDLAPFVVAGRYDQQEYHGSPCTVIIWKRASSSPEQSQRLARDVQQIAKTYDSVFGPRGTHPGPVWIVDSPVASAVSNPSALFPTGSQSTQNPATLAALPPDTAFFYWIQSREPLLAYEASLSLIASDLSETWLGNGRGLDLEGLSYPIKALPLYAERLADERLRGRQERSSTITDLLHHIPPKPPVMTDSSSAPGAEKSLLFFYALEDEYGRQHLHAALRHMVQARRGRSYDLQDLIAALEQETHQDVGSFFRLWLKHARVPRDFRARYEAPAAPSNASEENRK